MNMHFLFAALLSGAASATAVATPAAFVGAIKAPPEAEAQKAAFRKFGEVSCNDCEGGVDFDSKPKAPYDAFSGKFNEWAPRAGSWPVGHVHRWKGKASIGSISVIAEEQVEGFRCKRLEYKLVKGAQSATRPSLICFGLLSRDSSVENWHEIY